MMRSWLNRSRLNLGIKRKILKHPVVNEIVGSFLAPNRLKLPEVGLVRLIGGTADVVSMLMVPMNEWDTPYNDLVPLSALAKSVRPQRILEVGTCRGQATLQLAANCPDARIITYDIDEKAGVYFSDHPIRQRIELRIADFAADRNQLLIEGPFDFIFIDALHSFEAVISHSELSIELLGERGMIVWHDYSHRGSEWLLSENGVPEALWQLSQKRPIYSIRGTALAVLSKAPLRG